MRTPADYSRTGYSNVADKFVTCVQREGSHSITSDDCENLLALQDAHTALTSEVGVLSAENARLREALDETMRELLSRMGFLRETHPIIKRARAALAGGEK